MILLDNQSKVLRIRRQDREIGIKRMSSKAEVGEVLQGNNKRRVKRVQRDRDRHLVELLLLLED